MSTLLRYIEDQLCFYTHLSIFKEYRQTNEFSEEEIQKEIVERHNTFLSQEAGKSADLKNNDAVYSLLGKKKQYQDYNDSLRMRFKIPDGKKGGPFDEQSADISIACGDELIEVEADFNLLAKTPERAVEFANKIRKLLEDNGYVEKKGDDY
jgi:hypothetical protein